MMLKTQTVTRDDAVLVRLRGRIINASNKNGWLLARSGTVANQIHMAIGCGMTDCPERVVLSFMNNVAYLYGMEPTLRHGYYAGTIGKHDLGESGVIKDGRDSERLVAARRGGRWGKPNGGRGLRADEFDSQAGRR